MKELIVHFKEINMGRERVVVRSLAWIVALFLSTHIQLLAAKKKTLTNDDLHRAMLDSGSDEVLEFVRDFYGLMGQRSPARVCYESRDDGLDRDKRRLDSLARLLEGDETCSAVCLLGDRLLVATNRRDHTMDVFACPLMARIHALWGHLTMIARLSRESGYRAHQHQFVSATRGQFVGEALPYLIRGLGSKKKGYFKSVDVQLLREFGWALSEDFQRFVMKSRELSSEDLIRDWSLSLQSRVRLDRNVQKPAIVGSHILVPTGLANLVDRIELLTEPTVTGVYNLYRFFADLAKWEEYAASAGQKKVSSKILDLLADRKLRPEIVDQGDDGVHAEMRILSKLLSENAKEVSYIGISKLSCAHCNLILKGYESLRGHSCRRGPIARGTHAIACNWDENTFSWVLRYLNQGHDLLLPILGESLYQKYCDLKGKSFQLRSKKGKTIIPKVNALKFAINLIERIPSMFGKDLYRKTLESHGIFLPQGELPLYADRAPGSPRKRSTPRGKTAYFLTDDRLVVLDPPEIPRRSISFEIDSSQSSFEMADTDDEVLPSEDESDDDDGIAEDRHWYTEDEMNDLLRYDLPESEVHVVAQTPLEALEHQGGVVHANLRVAIQGVMQLGHVAVIPVNLHRGHWVGLLLYRTSEGGLRALYVDPLGRPLEQEEHALELVLTLYRAVELFGPGGPSGGRRVPELIDLQVVQQRNHYDCGPFTVANLVRLARLARAGGLDEIVDIAGLRQQIEAPGIEEHDRFARRLRRQQQTILRERSSDEGRSSEDIGPAVPSVEEAQGSSPGVVPSKISLLQRVVGLLTISSLTLTRHAKDDFR